MTDRTRHIGVFWPALWCVAFCCLLAASTTAQIVLDNQPELDRIDIVEHLGERIPLDLEFTSDDGAAVRLADFFNQGKPVVIVLGYYECPMLCNLVFNGLTEGMTGVEWTPGSEYTVLTVSIDPGESSQLAAAKKENYVAKFGRPEAADGWHFLVGAADQSEALAEAIGFKYFYDEKRDEYAHAAAVYLLTPDGTISRYLYGIQIEPRDLKFGLLEASDGKIGSTVDRLILYCFHYDPDEKGYVVMAGNVMKLGGAITLLFLTLLLGTLWWRERWRRKATPPVEVRDHPSDEGKRIYG